MNPHPPAPTCYRHRDRVTGLGCTRCGRPACPECLRTAAVGQHCVDCVRQAGGEVRPVRTVAGAPVQDRPTPVVTYGLIALNVAIFALTAAQAGSVFDNDRSALFRDWSLFPPLVGHGEWIRVLGAGFLHFGPIHLLVNMFALYVLGRDSEIVLGRLRYIAVYLVSLLGGSAAALAFAPTLSSNAGASGAIYGLFGAMTVILLRLRQSPVQMLVLIAINLLISVSLPGISLWAHLGGLAAGTAATAGILFVPEWLRARSGESARLIGWMAVGGVALVTLAIIVAAGLQRAL
ncbi:rhomboid family intramembrane serine protease [Nocardia sp. CDC159]|uniref:Rhomboid family intramembrane serine protease n=1 Tax=Nocardia pulmonis TaxID=2951408 RepID=A0A9X2EEW3_9NOCA|nr:MULTISPECIES: rhomboid family intramembrane serine protease [Nocardia]MCM6776953.1 rhomboid family intramembrane serine protease [Nocardia pulmonis]MCM6789377.1 rhomboid family intramembrane serine protease [Nocardia sp. CDC159]